MAIKKAITCCIIENDEIKATKEGVDGWIWLGECTEKEKEMFIKGAKFGGRNVLFQIAEQLNIVSEWEEIDEEFLRNKK